MFVTDSRFMYSAVPWVWRSGLVATRDVNETVRSAVQEARAAGGQELPTSAAADAIALPLLGGNKLTTDFKWELGQTYSIMLFLRHPGGLIVAPFYVGEMAAV